MMHSFKSDIIEFLHQQQRFLSFEECSKDLLKISRNSSVKPLFLSLHFLHESPEIHLRKIGKYASNPKQMVVHLWEDHWENERIKVASRLRSAFGITHRVYGRDTQIVRINNEQLLSFLKVNHLNVPIKAKYKYGLYKNEELLAVMSFSRSRVLKRGAHFFNSYELLRFCNKLEYTVVGGFSKLLKYFSDQQCPDDIMTYVDKDWSDGSTYLKAGFKLEDELPPMEFSFNEMSGERVYLTNSRAQESGIKVYNSGSYKFIKYIKQV